MIPLYVVGGIVLVLLIWLVGNYNALVNLRQHCRESWRNIDVQLKRRHDLIPNLVTTVKGYAKHERETLEMVIRARNEAVAHHGDQKYEKPLVKGMKQIFALAESYPDLKADRNFLELQEELADTEDRIAAARRFYNGNVRDLNQRVEMFPSSVVASMFNFEQREYWEVEEALEREHPGVNL
jgi:LemA protein